MMNIRNIEVFKKPNYEVEYEKAKQELTEKVAKVAMLQKYNTVKKAMEVVSNVLADENIK